MLINDALGFEGSLNGKVADTQSTRGATEEAAAQTVPPEFNTATTVVRFKDLAGNDLVDPNGEPIPPVAINADGTFVAENLPVGTDFTICADIDADGTCEVESCVNIPGEVGSEEGTLSGVRADPLTTVVLAKLRRLMEEQGIDPEDLPFSPAAVVSRIVSAYTNLFEDSGIDQEITLADLESLVLEQLADLFDEKIPSGARTGMRMVEGNLELSQAEEAEDLARAAAEVFLRAGFPIADLPGLPDLSSLGELEDVISMTPEEFFSRGGEADAIEGFIEGFLDDFSGEISSDLIDQIPDGFIEDLASEFPDGLPEGFEEDISGDLAQIISDNEFLIAVAEIEEGDPSFTTGERIYLSTVLEPDRNFANSGAPDGADGEGLPPLPILSDFILLQMARLHLENRTITLGDLYELLTSLENGLGARLTYFVFDPTFFGPPLNIFETADGLGKAVNIEKLFRRFFEAGLTDLDPETFDQQEGELRALMLELLGDTAPPAFGRLLAGILTDRLGSVDELADKIRKARAHLPFSRSGPSTFFVVADGDAFQPGSSASAVTVDAEVSVDGEVLSVSYNASGLGKYLLGFTEHTDDFGKVEFLVRETGRFLHTPHGPVRVSITDESLFAPVNGQPFADFVSDSGVFFPGANIAVINEEFNFESDVDGGISPHQQIFVLATALGVDDPVRVDYDRSSGVATFNPGGRNLLMFLPDSHETGLFALFNEDTGRPAGIEDPIDFFEAPPEIPEDFEDFFNTETQDLLHEADGEFLLLDGDPPPPDDQIAFEGDGTVLDEPIVNDDQTTVVDASTSTQDGTIATAEFVGDVSVEGFILVAAGEIVGLPLQPEFFTRVFGTEVPNDRYDSEGDPYFDDLNANGVQDPGEPTTPFRPMLFNADDWRSTDIRLYYRRSDNGESVTFEDVAFDALTPQTLDGVALVPRNYVSRLNAFRFARPNTAINLLTAFAPPDFFNGTHGLDRTTELDIFSAIAIINLIMDQVFNVEADIDLDGAGALPRQRTLVDAHLFVLPIDDPFVLLVKGFRERSRTLRVSE